jgi:putative ABC transport system permease protein
MHEGTTGPNPPPGREPGEAPPTRAGEYRRALREMQRQRSENRLQAAAEQNTIARFLRREFAAALGLLEAPWSDEALRLWERVPTAHHLPGMRGAQLKGLFYRAGGDGRGLAVLEELRGQATPPPTRILAGVRRFRLGLRRLRLLREELVALEEPIAELEARVDYETGRATPVPVAPTAPAIEAPPPATVPPARSRPIDRRPVGASRMLWLGARSVGRRLGMLLTPFLGLLLAGSLATGIMAFADSEAEAALQHELQDEGAFGVPRNSILVLQTEDAGRPIEVDLFAPLAAAMGAEPTLAVRAAVSLPLRPDPEALVVGAITGPLAVGYIEGLATSALLLEGRWPVAGAAGETLEATMNTAGMDSLGLLVGDQIRLRLPDTAGQPAVYVTARLVGRWRAMEPDSPYWFYDPVDTFGSTLMVEPAAFRAVLASGAGVGSAAWYAQFPTEGFTTDGIAARIRAIEALRLPGEVLPDQVRVVESPLIPLRRAVERLRELELQLLLIALPVVMALVYFVVMATRLGAEDRASELSTLRSRGAGALHIFVFLLSDFLLLGVAVAAAAPFLGLYVARVIHQARGFLVFGAPAEAEFTVAPEQFVVAGVAMAAAAAAATVAAYGASSPSAVIHRSRIARRRAAPVWQRYYLDLLMLVAGAYLLLRFMWAGASSAAGLRSDPLTIGAPVLCIVGLSLLATRLLPPALEVARRVLDRLGAGSEELAVRHLSRAIATHRAGFVLVSATVATGFFLASAASSLDLNEDLRTRFDYGADLLLVEGRPPGAPAHLGPGLGEAGVGLNSPASPYVNFPADLHLASPGVEAAARLWRGEALLVGATIRPVAVYAVSPDEFAGVAWWRDDFADAPLVDLLDALRGGNGAIVSGDLLAENGHSPGSSLQLRFGPDDDGAGGPPYTDLRVTVTGSADLFPTHRPDSGSFVIVDLRRLMLEIGERPWDVLVRRAPDSDLQEVLAGFAAQDLPVLSAHDVAAELQRLRADPLRVGVFGVLSVGFAWILLLALILFIYQAALTFRRRRPQVGILRATGMSSFQLARWLATENSLSGALSVVAGLGVGAITAWFFLIMLEVAVGGATRAPAFQVAVEWERALQFAGIALAGMVAAALVSFVAARRVDLHQAIQLADEQY